MNKVNYLLLLFSLIFVVPTYAGDNKKDTAKAGSGYIVLVALHSERNRIAEARRLGDNALLTAVLHDAEEIRKRTIMDFTDNFKDYPVYYIMDTNIIKITKGIYTDILVNADGTAVKVAPPALEAKKFVIAFYTRPNMLFPSEKEITDSNRWAEESGALNYGLVLFNNKFQQFNNYRKHALRNLDQKELKYYYKSLVCDMEYYPLASRMSATRNEKRGVVRFFGL